MLRWLSGFARISERSSRSRDAARVASRCLLNLFPTRSIVTDSQNAPEVLPELSVSATRLKQAKLKKTPFDHSGGHPGKLWVQRALDVMFEVGNQAIFIYQTDEHPDTIHTSVLSQDLKRIQQPYRTKICAVLEEHFLSKMIQVL